MAQAMKAGPFKTKKDAVEAGLVALARARPRIARSSNWRGKLKWEGDESIDWTKPPPQPVAPRRAIPRRGRSRAGR